MKTQKPPSKDTKYEKTKLKYPPRTSTSPWNTYISKAWVSKMSDSVAWGTLFSPKRKCQIRHMHPSQRTVSNCYIGKNKCYDKSRGFGIISIGFDFLLLKGHLGKTKPKNKKKKPRGGQRISNVTIVKRHYRN